MYERFNLYSIQKDFIKRAQEVIDNDKIGIFSSPTGTGKTRSLLLSLRKYIRNGEYDIDNNIADINSNNNKNNQYTKENNSNSNDHIKNNHISSGSFGLSNENQSRLADLFDSESPRTTTIFYCSRTHSQLTQAINELKIICPEARSMIIGSRKVYCINEKVIGKNNVNLGLDIINERCGSLVENNGCGYYNNFIGNENNLSLDNNINKVFEKSTISSNVKNISRKKNFTNNEEIINNRYNSKEYVFEDLKFKNKQTNLINENTIKKSRLMEKEEISNLKVKTFQKIAPIYNKNDFSSIIHMSNTKIIDLNESNKLKKNEDITIENLLNSQKSQPKTVLDIEDIISSCKKKKICPYFYSKSVSQDCDVLFMPYTLLFSQTGRKSFNIELKNSIVVVDEAHNIFETVIQMNSVVLNKNMIDKFYSALVKYFDHYQERMNEDNLKMCKMVIKVLEHMCDFFNVIGVKKDFEDSHFKEELLKRKIKDSCLGNNKKGEINNGNKIFNEGNHNNPFKNTVSKTKDSRNSILLNPNIRQIGFKKKENLMDKSINDEEDKKLNKEIQKKNINNTENNSLIDEKKMFFDRNKQHGTLKNEKYQENDFQFCIKVSEFLIKSNLYDFNMIEIEDFISEYKLTQKIENMVKENLNFFSVSKFLKLLTISDENGRIFYNNKYIRFTPLDPKIYFEDILKCRALILAGGTMEPIDNLVKVLSKDKNENITKIVKDKIDRLKKLRDTNYKENSIYANEDQYISKGKCVSGFVSAKEIQNSNRMVFNDGTLEYFSYKHVCEKYNAFILSEGPAKKELKLCYENKNDHNVILEYINSIFNLSNTIKKGGIICFLPSKSYLKIFRDEILSNKLFTKFAEIVLFDGETSFDDYKNTLERKEKLILFSIMGGKLSEGINFSDNLCRLLIIIGIPYPTLNLELQEREKHHTESNKTEFSKKHKCQLNQNFIDKTTLHDNEHKLYRNIKTYNRNYSTLIAMKTVNQALGRALRHKNDFGCIVLMDCRYRNLVKYLSSWVNEKLYMKAFQQTMIDLIEFYKNHHY